MAHFGQAPSLLDLIPGARAGVNYLLGAVADFQRLPLRLNAAQTNVIAAKRAAEFTWEATAIGTFRVLAADAQRRR